MNLTELPALALVRAIRAKELSSVEVVAAHLQRIEAVNPRLNAVVQLSQTALSEARAADAAVARGEALGVLHGVPFTVKDWIETAGIVCAAGVEMRREYVPKHDAPVVARMRAAGAVLLGKTKPGATDDVYPAAHNPYDVTRTPGGSSAGEAVIIAACGSPIGLGSDSGGSIRQPAHYCGIAGLKPTSGRVPNTGHFPPITALADPRTVIGPMARSVDDLAAVLSIIAGADAHDASVVPMPIAGVDGVDVGALRVARFDAFDGATCSSDVVHALSAAVAVLSQAHASVRTAVPPRIEESMAITRAYWARPESMSTKAWRPWGKSTLNADDVERSLFEWDRLRRAFLGFMSEFDLIVCPVAATATPPTGAANRPEDYVYMLPFSLVGYPVAVVRAGTSSDGMPIGVQVVARPWCEHVALAAARTIERALGGWKRTPI
jgi:amidase